MSNIEYMNNKNMCIACFKKPEQGQSSIIINGKRQAVKIPLIKHHVRYEPEIIAFVHFQCHIDIHDGKHPHLIQYERRDSLKHYKEKNEN